MSSKKDGETPEKPRWNVSRRGFIRGVGLGGGALGALEEEAQAAPQPGAKVLGPGPVAITLTVNGKPQKLAVEPRMTLLDALRDKLDLTGAKATCDRGTCGSCTVVMGGKAVYACSILAVDAQGKNIQTIESVATNDPLVTAMVHNDGTQCGFCAPGIVMATKAFLAKHPNSDDKQIAASLGGNLCRCGAYVPIRKAILETSRKGKGGANA